MNQDDHKRALEARITELMRVIHDQKEEVDGLTSKMHERCMKQIDDSNSKKEIA